MHCESTSGRFAATGPRKRIGGTTSPLISVSRRCSDLSSRRTVAELMDRGAVGKPNRLSSPIWRLLLPKWEPTPPKLIRYAPKMGADPAKLVPDPSKLVPDPAKLVPDPPKLVPDPPKLVSHPPKLVPDPPKMGAPAPKMAGGCHLKVTATDKRGWGLGSGLERV
jgi:hypothetical protein